jgi:hypothetical protein
MIFAVNDINLFSGGVAGFVFPHLFHYRPALEVVRGQYFQVSFQVFDDLPLRFRNKTQTPAVAGDAECSTDHE